MVAPVTPRVPPIVALFVTANVLLGINTRPLPFAVICKSVFEVVPLIVLPLIVTLGKVNVPVPFMLPVTVAVPVDVKLPVCVKLPV